QMTRTASLKAFAKLNLGLRVLAKRPDGYHELRTVFQTISLADRLEVRLTPSRTSGVTVFSTPEIAENLVEKTCRIAMQALKISAKIELHLEKLIPTGAGLGGGSSDAAAVLLTVPVLAGKRVCMEQLLELAAQLGSDVPFFLRGGTALGLGRGEELYPLPDAPASRALLVAPDVHSSTADAYRDLSAGLTPATLPSKLSSFQQQTWNPAAQFANDFESVIFARHPELARIKKRLLRLGASKAVMTGSGSAIFGVFNNPEQLLKAREGFAEAKTYPITFLNRARYRSSWLRALQPHVKGDQWPPQSLYAQ
ncbi:MAG TPA: 4-(cytidine 5'-diphospho)-2-C-methyl-D-erythritol kinase, partial [Bryobacteraceae bacterium]|nr:4-(cytidine 5'-diphospho)-2-C-methyl-D-erythritol kinase [Bryobacteraceae bacterium]